MKIECFTIEYFIFDNIFSSLYYLLSNLLEESEGKEEAE